MVLPPITGRDDLAGLWRHRAMFVRLRPDVVQFNLSTASSCQWAILAATTVPGIARVVVENSPMGVWSSTSGRLKQLTSRRLAGHVAVGDRTGSADRGVLGAARRLDRHDLPRGARRRSRAGRPGSRADAAHRRPPRPGQGHRRAARRVHAGSEPRPARADRRRARERGAAAPVPPSSASTTGSSSGRCRGRCAPSDLMWAYDALVLPSRLEGFPVTIAEAMLAGLPVVATDVGSVAEAVMPGETGWIVRAGGPRRPRCGDPRAARRPRPSGRAWAPVRGSSARRASASTRRSDAYLDDVPTHPRADPGGAGPQIW